MPGPDARWQPDDVRIVTVGIDIGSTTSVPVVVKTLLLDARRGATMAPRGGQ